MSDGPAEPQVAETPEPTTEPQPTVTETPQESSGNPAWQPILDKVPNAFHNEVRPTLEEWDKGVQKRFQEIHQKYEPFKQYVEQQVDPRRLELGLRLVDQIDADPAAFYEQLGERFRALGYIKEAEAAEAKADELSEEEEQEPEFKDPRLDVFMNQVREAQEQLEQQKAEQEAERQIETELQEVQKLHGKPLEDWFQMELLNRARIMFDAAVEARRPTPTLVDAYNSLMEFTGKFSQQSPKGPPVIPSGGGQPAPQIDRQKIANDPKARREAAVGLMKGLLG